jgi:hypothetical protein
MEIRGQLVSTLTISKKRIGKHLRQFQKNKGPLKIKERAKFF